DGVRGRPAGATHRHHDVEQLRVHLFGRVLVGDRPARRATGRAQFVVQRELVDLYDDAVDLVLDVVAVLTVVRDEVQHTVDVVARAAVGTRRHTQIGEKRVDLAL